MPKLVQINVVSNILSTGKICEDIGKVAISNGWESFVAYGRNAKPSASKELTIGSMSDVYRHYIAHRLFDREGLCSEVPTRKLVEQLKQIAPDIIVLHNIHDHYLNYPVLFKYLASINTPVVWVQHDCWAFTGGCMYFDMLECERWKNGCGRCPEKRAYFLNKSGYQYGLKKELLDKLKNLTFVSVSNWLAGLLGQSYLGHKPIQVIHNGTDVSVFKPYGKGNKETFGILGVAADWVQRKGLFEFYKLRELLDSNFSITLVGLTKRQIKELPDGIVGIERTTSIKELAKLYSNSDVFVNPTFSDNFPTTNIEALACGTPVITYKTGGSPEAIDERTGAAVEQGDIKGLAEAIVGMKKSPLSSEDCRNRAVQLFDKEKCFMKYIELFNHLLSE